MDWEALAALETMFIPWVPWDGISSPELLRTLLPNRSPHPTNSESPARVLCALFDQRAVQHHFADFVEHGKDAYVRSHFGEMGRQLLGGEEFVVIVGQRMLRRIGLAGNMRAFVLRLRQSGLEHLVNKFMVRSDE